MSADLRPLTDSLLAVVAYAALGGALALTQTLTYGVTAQSAIWSLHGLIAAVAVVGLRAHYRTAGGGS